MVTVIIMQTFVRLTMLAVKVNWERQPCLACRPDRVWMSCVKSEFSQGQGVD